MSLKSDGGMCLIREQVVAHQTSGLTFHFELRQDGGARMTVRGRGVPPGTEIAFDADGIARVHAPGEDAWPLELAPAS